MMNIQTLNISWRVIEWRQKEEATVRTIIQQDAVGNPPANRTQQRHVQLQGRLQNIRKYYKKNNELAFTFN
jgi:hypothetical protein